MDKVAAAPRSHLLKIVIPSFKVDAIRTDLETCGIDDITVFPDLEGLSRTVEKKWKEEEQRLPHEGVATRLGHSRLHGVGVFAIGTIRKDSKLFLGDYDDFAALKNGRYGCPVNWATATLV
jgi:hypothetical protein